jgi:SAM-dependent methyltransferase
VVSVSVWVTPSAYPIRARDDAVPAGRLPFGQEREMVSATQRETHAERVAAVRARLARGGYEGRTRRLDRIDRRLAAAGTPLERAIIEQRRARAGRRVSVLEIGMGWGATLLDLAWRFRTEPVSFAGLNLEAKPPVERSEDLLAVAEALEIVPSGRAGELRPPAVHFHDATELRVPDESLDLVYSAVTIQFIADKIAVLEQVARALRPGGRALLDIAGPGWDYPAAPASEPPALTVDPAPLVLLRDGALVPVAEHLTARGGERFAIAVPSGRRCVVDLRKRAAGRLDLGLERDDELTVPLADLPLPPGARRPSARVMRSVYRVAR